MTTLTSLEAAALRAIDLSEFGDSDLLAAIWSSELVEYSDIGKAQIGGVVSSLCQKGFLKQAGNGRDATVWMTEAGADAFLAEMQRRGITPCKRKYR